MTEQVATGSIDVNGHVCLAAAQWATVGDVGNIVAEGLRVDGVAKLKERRQLGQRLVIQSIEVCKISRLVDLVNIGLLGCELDVGFDLTAHRSKEGIVDEAIDDGVLVGFRLSILFRVGVKDLLIKEASAESLLGFLGTES